MIFLRNEFLNGFFFFILLKFLISRNYQVQLQNSWSGMWANSVCRYFTRLRSLKNAVSFSKVPKIIFWGAGCVGAQYIFRKYLKLLHYSHFYFAFNTHDIWKLFFFSKICQQKVSGISRLSKKPKSHKKQVCAISKFNI